jgi:hypothetical protein
LYHVERVIDLVGHGGEKAEVGQLAPAIAIDDIDRGVLKFQPNLASGRKDEWTSFIGHLD